MIVKIQQRSVYHKFAEIEIEIPNDVDEFDIQDYVNDNEHLWVDKMDKQMSESEFVFEQDCTTLKEWMMQSLILNGDMIVLI